MPGRFLSARRFLLFGWKENPESLHQRISELAQGKRARKVWGDWTVSGSAQGISLGSSRIVDLKEPKDNGVSR